MTIGIQEETIIAQATSKTGNGALALIRLSGKDAFAITDTFAQLASCKKIAQEASHTIHYGSIRNESGELIDQVLFFSMRAPRTFTGEDTVEISCHNNAFIIQAIIDQAIKNGARSAQPGEFSRRAVLNNKIDLVQAEAINDIIGANTQFALKKSLEQLQGSLSHWLQSCELRLLRALAFCEVSFDFLDEEVSFSQDIKGILSEIETEIKKNKRSFDQQQAIKQGMRIALIGAVNSGKSSLFNRLIGRDRAIISNQAGTTRDTLEAEIARSNYHATLIDTAGLRTTKNIIESEGIKRSFEEAHKADVIILVCDSSKLLLAEQVKLYSDIFLRYPTKTIIVSHKADLKSRAQLDEIFPSSAKIVSVSSVTQEGLSELEEVIFQKINLLFDSLDAPFLLNRRHYETMLSLEQKLITTQELLRGMVQYEILSCHLKDCLELVSELTGKSVTEYSMDTVFKQFCVGK